MCEKLLSYASPLGLYGEELDPDTGRHLGNYPQAFTHLALINAVMHVIRSEHGAAPILAAPLSPQTARPATATANAESENGGPRHVAQPARAESAEDGQ